MMRIFSIIFKIAELNYIVLQALDIFTDMDSSDDSAVPDTITLLVYYIIYIILQIQINKNLLHNQYNSFIYY